MGRPNNPDSNPVLGRLQPGKFDIRRHRKAVAKGKGWGLPNLPENPTRRQIEKAIRELPIDDITANEMLAKEAKALFGKYMNVENDIADQMSYETAQSLSQCNQIIKDLMKRAKSRKLTPEQQAMMYKELVGYIRAKRDMIFLTVKFAKDSKHLVDPSTVEPPPKTHSPPTFNLQINTNGAKTEVKEIAHPPITENGHTQADEAQPEQG